MATKKKAAKKAAPKKTRKKRTPAAEVREPLVKVRTIKTVTATDSDEVFNDIMLLLDNLAPLERGRVAMRVLNTLKESKADALSRAQTDYEQFSKVLAGIAVEEEPEVETGSTSDELETSSTDADSVTDEGTDAEAAAIAAKSKYE